MLASTAIWLLALLACVPAHTLAFPFDHDHDPDIEIIVDVSQGDMFNNAETLERGTLMVENGTTDASPVEASKEEEAAWACDIRAWTRAPDLSPGVAIPAQARLAVNGSACGDIVKWEVGLRYKERAIMKRKAPGIELPKKPIRPAWNASRFDHHRRVDWNSLYAPSEGMFWRDNDQEYEDAMEVYNEQMSNESLWDVRSQERIVFDITKPLDWPSIETSEMDVVRDFAIHVPNTNFPPMLKYQIFGPEAGKDEQMLNTETSHHHYHLVHLANGTVLDIPSGLSAFVPVAGPVSSPLTSVSESASEGSRSPSAIQEENEWPRVIHFEPINRTQSDRDEDMYRGPRAPTCDKDAEALFAITVSSNITRPTLGQNITLNISLTRIGNGTEIPTHLDVHHTTERNVTWAHEFLSGEEEYTDLTGKRRGDRHSFRWMGTGEKMLISPDQGTLEHQRLKMESSGRSSGWSRRGGEPWPLGEDGSRVEVWEHGSERIVSVDETRNMTEWVFGMELALRYNDYPSFEKTFETIRSTLTFTLHTAFTCDVRKRPSAIDPAESDQTSDPNSSSLGERPIDKEWEAWELPIRPKSDADQLGSVDLSRLGRSYTKQVSTPLGARIAHLPSGRVVVLHYSDEDALGPVLAERTDSRVEFPRLDLRRRDEGKEDLKKSRYGRDDRHSIASRWCNMRDVPRRCHELNTGGAGTLAGGMWQRKEAMDKIRAEKELEGERKKGNEFVVQT